MFALADSKDRAPSDLDSPPLYDVVDASALVSTLFENGNDRDGREGTGTVEFRHGGALVTISSDGWVRIYEPSARRGS